MLDPVGQVVRLDRVGRLVLRDHLERKAPLGLAARKVTLDPVVPLDPQAQQERRDRLGLQAQAVHKVTLAQVVRLDRLGHRAISDRLGQVVLLAHQGRADLRDQVDLLDRKETLAPVGHLVPVALLERLERKAHQGRLDRLARRVMLEQLDRVDRLVLVAQVVQAALVALDQKRFVCLPRSTINRLPVTLRR